ncbi:LuxR C-terminal-related transcriptional regulator [Modestobacter altitudinis]|uniref:LuxR C-terminal-related transcriptional regulator n=1 Tax=Modestobacter altitudinis TaxID=2213158 RepID=UPI0015D3733A|nr:LuxR C-terminal-related transcriptional regulator [Modestobacter altitudinis]
MGLRDTRGCADCQGATSQHGAQALAGVGAELFISEKAASVHVSNILAKFGASGRTEAVALAARGLLS